MKSAVSPEEVLSMRITMISGLRHPRAVAAVALEEEYLKHRPIERLRSWISVHQCLDRI